MKVLLILFISCSGLANILIEKSIKINLSSHQVFETVKDARNDYLWRDEVHSVETLYTDFIINNIYLEDAKLGIHKHYYTETYLEEIGPLKAIYRTTDANPYFLKSSRFVAINGENKSTFTYLVEFEEDLIRDIWGLPIPVFLAKAVYGEIMEKYLRNLKIYLENNTN